MTAAPFVWRADGRPDWRAMWESFCDLALHGGPPHRGAERALRAPAGSGAAAASDPAMVAEIRRGIWETTGLFSEAAGPGWIAVTCDSAAMAAWLAAAIVLENVAARAEDDRLLLAAGPGYRLEDEVKSTITVVAKTHHYWDAHGARPARADEHTHGPGQPCHAHGFTPSTAVARSPRGVPRPLVVGVGGPASGGKSTLIEAIRRRLAGRLVVAVSGAGTLRGDIPTPDLLLVERTGPSAAATFSPDLVDATIGVLDLAGAREDEAGHAAVRWRLLVVSKVDLAPALGVDPHRVARALRDRRGDDGVVLTDLTAVDGADAVVAWLEHELLLGL
jgi:Ni2+-binding GTPase involved in maturation of urease and hydrogenase